LFDASVGLLLLARTPLEPGASNGDDGSVGSAGDIANLHTAAWLTLEGAEWYLRALAGAYQRDVKSIIVVASDRRDDASDAMQANLLVAECAS
jgi:hypothetical protein